MPKDMGRVPFVILTGDFFLGSFGVSELLIALGIELMKPFILQTTYLMPRTSLLRSNTCLYSPVVFSQGFCRYSPLHSHVFKVTDRV